LDRFHRENVVFSSHLVAFAAWHTLLKAKKDDLYGLLAVQEEDLFVSHDVMISTVDRLHVRLRELEREGRLRMAAHLHTDIRTIIEHGLKNLGVYHIDVPLLRGSKGEILTRDSRLLYFYANRLNGYDLEKYV
jgi:glycerol-3-phosphate O-acyltransferase